MLFFFNYSTITNTNDFNSFRPFRFVFIFVSSFTFKFLEIFFKTIYYLFVFYINPYTFSNRHLQPHPYHLVDVSPFPLLMALSIMTGAFSLVSWFAHYPINPLTFIPALIIIATLWWRDVVREAKGGFHTQLVQRGILIGFLLFLLSEIMLFFSLFWAFFHSALAPNIELGAIWPPVGKYLTFHPIF